MVSNLPTEAQYFLSRVKNIYVVEYSALWGPLLSTYKVESLYIADGILEVKAVLEGTEHKAMRRMWTKESYFLSAPHFFKKWDQKDFIVWTTIKNQSEELYRAVMKEYREMQKQQRKGGYDD